MNAILDYDQCLSFLNCEIKPTARPAARKLDRFCAVTISRATGSGAYSIAEHLAESLTKADRKAPCPWTVFDGNLIEKVLEDHNESPRLANRFPEDRLSEVEDSMDELFGLRPTPSTVVEQTSETILKLCALGNVIVIGRGGNMVARRLPGVLHVRLVGSLETRVRRLSENRGMTPKSALAHIQKADLGRSRYLKKYFGADIDDPQIYHLIINTDLLGSETAAQLIAHTVLNGA
jgi:cytidylate kinase